MYNNHSNIPLLDCSKDKNKYQFLFQNFSKEEWIKEQLSSADSAFYEIIREEVEEFYYKVIKNNHSILHFDDMYNIAKQVTINQIQKSLRKHKRCFFENKGCINDTSMYYSRIKSRLVNNLHNLTQTSRKINVLDVPYMIISDIYTNYEIDFTVLDIEKIAIKEPSKLIFAINSLLNNYDLSYDEAVEISQKYNIDSSNFLIFNFSQIYRNLKKVSNNQIVIDFYMEVA
ncbi:hypothetical protein [Aliarcobacter butzleri]|uniref:hypothetical protein n=1 Tax=Aliarcobacter butzleri TaxID=28197 RepID=UPI0021B3A8E3|nr:hypothetical protein [Aliarcobacter butzleri]MCT7594246.1 hypothetical protein [Aliarcobacter butzleri]MCT7598869.1 hypothetical protein [Aliarcobacter butzleri]MCT7652807.1 hypothetical protein [Aliarcobacter butzleri]